MVTKNGVKFLALSRAAASRRFDRSVTSSKGGADARVTRSDALRPAAEAIQLRRRHISWRPGQKTSRRGGLYLRETVSADLCTGQVGRQRRDGCSETSLDVIHWVPDGCEKKLTTSQVWNATMKMVSVVRRATKVSLFGVLSSHRGFRP